MEPEKQIVTAKKNPIFPGMGLCDPHGVVFGDTLYLFTDRDADPHTRGFVIDDWQVWRTTDGVHFEHCQTIRPEETFTGPMHACWATDAAERNGKYYGRL